MKKNCNNNKGFTLIEVLVSMAIIGLMAIAFLPLFTDGFRWIYSAGHRSSDNHDFQADIEREITEEIAESSSTFLVTFSDGSNTVDISVAGGVSTKGSYTVFVPDAQIVP